MQQRQGLDRRQHPRGGRRSYDRQGYSPLVMVIESDAARREVTETILAKLRFAVVPVESVERAVALSGSLRPAVIVCPEPDAENCAGLLSPPIPVVPLAPAEHDDSLIERIREAIRASKIVRFEAARHT